MFALTFLFRFYFRLQETKAFLESESEYDEGSGEYNVENISNQLLGSDMDEDQNYILEV